MNKISVKKILVAYFILFVLIVMGVYFYYSPINFAYGYDKLFHFLGFALLIFLLHYIYILHFGSQCLNKFLFSTAILGILLSTIAEVIQFYLPGRSFEFFDWSANTLGVFLAVAVTYFINIKKNSVEEYYE